MKSFIKILLAGFLTLDALCLQADDLKYIDPENPEIGRLADGQAYRKDQDGTKIVDYIAELEMQALELNRSLDASRNEITQLKAEVQRLQSGRQEFVVKEADLQSPEQGGLSVCEERVRKQAVSIQKLQDELAQTEEIDDARASFDPAAFKGSVQQELRELLVQKDSRDMLLSQKPQLLEINPALRKIQQEPESLSGRTIAEIEAALENAGEIQTLSDIRLEIAQIKARLYEQTDLLQ